VQNIAQLTPTEQDDLDAISASPSWRCCRRWTRRSAAAPPNGITGIIQHLRDLGVDDNTMVVYMSDNGWHWGEHRTQAKNKPYDESIRTAMFVRYSKLAPLPRVETRMALNIDMCPTFVVAHASPDGSGADARLRRHQPGAPDGRHHADLAQRFPHRGMAGQPRWASVREADWKYTELPIDPGNPLTTFEYELYDLVTIRSSSTTSTRTRCTRCASDAMHDRCWCCGRCGRSTPTRCSKIWTNNHRRHRGAQRLRLISRCGLCAPLW
jgi:ribosomal protein S27AE